MKIEKSICKKLISVKKHFGQLFTLFIILQKEIVIHIRVCSVINEVEESIYDLVLETGVPEYLKSEIEDITIAYIFIITLFIKYS
jgi:hypothetical protein